MTNTEELNEIKYLFEEYAKYYGFNIVVWKFFIDEGRDYITIRFNKDIEPSDSGNLSLWYDDGHGLYNEKSFGITFSLSNHSRLQILQDFMVEVDKMECFYYPSPVNDRNLKVNLDQYKEFLRLNKIISEDVAKKKSASPYWNPVTFLNEEGYDVNRYYQILHNLNWYSFIFQMTPSAYDQLIKSQKEVDHEG